MADVQCYRNMCEEVAAPEGILIEGAAWLEDTKGTRRAFCSQSCLDYYIHHGGSLEETFASRYVPPTQHAAHLEYQAAMTRGDLQTESGGHSVSPSIIAFPVKED